MPLTVKEKEHWKERIEKKIDAAIEKAYRDEGSGLRDTIRQQAKTRVMKHYGLENYMRQYSSRKAQIEELQSQQLRASEAASKPFENTSSYYCWSERHSLIVGVIDRAAKDVEKEILQESEFGRKILRLERERDELIDTIWLAIACQSYYLRVYALLSMPRIHSIASAVGGTLKNASLVLLDFQDNRALVQFVDEDGVS